MMGIYENFEVLDEGIIQIYHTSDGDDAEIDVFYNIGNDTAIVKIDGKITHIEEIDFIWNIDMEELISRCE